MTWEESLDRLAQLVGIEDGWWDFFGTWWPVPRETKKAFLEAMGFAVATEADVQACLEEFEFRPWLRWLEPVAVMEVTAGRPSVFLTVPAFRDTQTLVWSFKEEGGASRTGQMRLDTLEWVEERWIAGALYKRWRLPLPLPLTLGYHQLSVTAEDGGSATMVVAITPERAYVPEVVDEDRKAWGLATQIYALRNDSDWGVGTYGALAELAAGAAAQGAATIGINPLHALFPDQPEKYSPYAPSSRRFLNIAYIDVEAIPEFSECLEAKRMFASPGFQANLARVRGYPLVEYVDVAQLKAPLLEVLYRWFRDNHLGVGDARGQAFRAFQQEGGRIAELFCTFEALHEEFLRQDNSYWRQWPEELRHPASPGVAAFAAEKRDRVEFFWWLQFIADQQLGAAHKAALDGGAGIGLYRDLGVGIAGDGAESWLEQDNLALGISVGAPPDPLALKGQDWGLLPFNPISLRESAYAPFIGVMRANMRHAGALRLDHAMALQRLYWVPQGCAADQGAYVRYPVDDLFRLVALESVRAKCLIIGEDLGTVPEGFRERMDRMALFAYRVMVFEQRDNRFKRPDEFDRQALAIFATHDLPSARGYWNGADIDRREKLDLYPRPGMAEEERSARQADRVRLIAALADEGVLERDFPDHGPLDDAAAEKLAEAGHLFLARARSKLMMVQIEDVLGLDTQMNLPGTTDQHPNWRRRFPMDVATLLKDMRLIHLSNRLKACRGGGRT